MLCCKKRLIIDSLTLIRIFILSILSSQLQELQGFVYMESPLKLVFSIQFRRRPKIGAKHPVVIRSEREMALGSLLSQKTHSRAFEESERGHT